MNAFFRRGISRFPHELLIELPTLNTWPFMIRKIITGKEIAGNGFLAMERNSTQHRESLSVKLANMSGFLAVAGTLLIIDYSPTANTFRKKKYGIA